MIPGWVRGKRRGREPAAIDSPGVTTAGKPGATMRQPYRPIGDDSSSAATVGNRLSFQIT